MSILVLVICMVGQADDGKDWLVARLLADSNFNTEKIAEIEKKLNNLSPSQIRVLVEVYKIQKERFFLAEQQAAHNAEVLAKQRLQSYKQKLNREAQYDDLVEKQQLELLRYAGKMQNYMMHNYWPRPPYHVGHHVGHYHRRH